MMIVNTGWRVSPYAGWGAHPSAQLGQGVIRIAWSAD